MTKSRLSSKELPANSRIRVSDKDYRIAAENVVTQIYTRPPATNQIAGDKAIEWAMTQYFKLLLVDLVRTEGRGFTNHAICGPPKPEDV